MDLIELLLGKGADVNAPANSDGGITALQGAAKRGNINLVKLLLDAGADVNAPAAPHHGVTALEAAVGKGRHEVVELLLDRSPDCKTSNALRTATRKGNIPMILILLDAGADISARPSTTEESIFELAIAHDELDLRKELSTSRTYGNDKYDEVDEVASRFAKVKHAWYRQDFPFVYKMLELSVGTGILPMYSDNALAIAVKRLHDTNIDLVEFLLKIGVAVDARKNDDSPTALHSAIVLHDFPVIQTLMEAGANIHLLWDNRTIIQTAVEGVRGKLCHPRVIFHAWNLFDSPADLDDVSYESFFDGVQAEIMDLDSSDLLKAMRLKSSEEFKHRAARAVAIAQGQWQQHTAEMVQKFLDAGFDPNIRHEKTPTALQSAAYLGCTRLVQSLLNAKADVNAPPKQTDEPGEETAWTALQASIMVESDSLNLDIIHLLLDHGADINAPAPLGYGTRTALQAAIEGGNIELIRLLLSRGANINAPAGPERGMTALQAAAIKGYVGLAAQLLEAGADVNAPGSLEYGRTALEGAAEMGRLDMVKLLLNAGAGYDEHGYLSYKMALKYAKREGHRAIHDLIKEYFDKKLATDSSNGEEGITNTRWGFEGTGWGPYYDASDPHSTGYLFGDQGRYFDFSQWDGLL